MLHTTQHKYIVTDDDILGGEPIVVGTRTSVRAIVEICSSDMVNVQLGPIGPQWCSDQLLGEIANLSAETGLRIHMHLLESPRQRLWLDRRFPGPAPLQPVVVEGGEGRQLDLGQPLRGRNEPVQPGHDEAHGEAVLDRQRFF